MPFFMHKPVIAKKRYCVAEPGEKIAHLSADTFEEFFEFYQRCNLHPGLVKRYPAAVPTVPGAYQLEIPEAWQAKLINECEWVEKLEVKDYLERLRKTRHPFWHFWHDRANQKKNPQMALGLPEQQVHGDPS